MTTYWFAIAAIGPKGRIYIVSVSIMDDNADMASKKAMETGRSLLRPTAGYHDHAIKLITSL